MTNGMTNGGGAPEDFWASIRERTRKNGAVSYTVLCRVDGRQFPMTFRDQKQAHAFQALVKAHGVRRALEMNGLSAPARSPKSFTVAGWVDQHIESLSGVEQKTIAEYRRFLTRDITPTLGDVPLETLTREDVARWVNKLSAAGNSGKTIGNKIGFLSGCLNAAATRTPALIPANPAAGIRLPRTPRRQMTTLTPGEYQLLKALFTERWHPLLDFLVTSGCRFSEATALTPGDVDREAGAVRIWKSWKRTPGGYEPGAPKTNAGNRTVFVPGWVIDNLDLTGEYVFTNSQGGPIRLYSWRSNVWNKSLAKARTKPDDDTTPYLTKKPRIHDLRHTAASLWLSQGVPLITVSAQLGHEDVATTSRIYAHLIDGAGKAAPDAMTKALGMPAC